MRLDGGSERYYCPPGLFETQKSVTGLVAGQYAYTLSHQDHGPVGRGSFVESHYCKGVRPWLPIPPARSSRFSACDCAPNSGERAIQRCGKRRLLGSKRPYPIFVIYYVIRIVPALMLPFEAFL